MYKYTILIFLIIACDTPEESKEPSSDEFYIVNLDSIHEKGSNDTLQLEVYSSAESVTISIGNIKTRLFDNGDYTQNGDFLKGDNVYSNKVLLSQFSLMDSISYEMNNENSQHFEGYLYFLENVSYDSIITHASYSNNVNSNTDSQLISIEVDTAKLRIQNIVSISYVKLNVIGDAEWAETLNNISDQRYEINVPNIKLCYGSKDSTFVDFGFEIKSNLRSEIVHKHSVLLRNKQPVFVSDSIFEIRQSSGRNILPVEITVDNFEGIDEINQVYIVSLSGSKIQFSNDGLAHNDRISSDNIWRVELDVTTGSSGTHRFKGFIIDKGGNISNEFEIEFSL